MAKELSKYCHISKFLEKTDPKFRQILDDYCLLAALRPRKGLNGLTFIMPGAATKKKLGELLMSDDIEQGIEIVKSHIIHDYLPTAEDWQKFKDDVPNAHNKRVSVAVKSGKVTIEDGVEITPDPKFKQFSNKEANESVWTIVGKKELGYNDKAEPAKFTYAKRGAHAAVKGGHFARPVSNAATYLSHQLHKFCASAFNGEERIDNPMFEDLVSLFHCLKAHHRQEYDALICQMTPAPVCSFIFAMLNISPAAFDSWYRSGRFPVDRAVTAWHQLLTSAAAEIGPDPAGESKLLVDINKANFFDKIKQHYKAQLQARGGGVSDDRASKLFAYHLATFREVSLLIPCLQEIMAARGGGFNSPSNAADLRSDVKGLLDTIRDERSIYLTPTAKICDSDCIATLVGIFAHSDMCGYRLHAITQAADGNLTLRPQEGDDEVAVLPHAMWFNATSYDDSARDPSAIVPQLAGLSDDKWAQLLAAVDALRKKPQAPAAAAPAAAAPVEAAK